MAPGCYTGARATGGRVWLARRHVARLVRDARLLGLGEVSEALAHRLLAELAAPTRGGGADLKVRLEAHPDPGRPPRLRGGATELTPEPPAWRAIAASAPHPGPTATSTAKTLARAHYEAAFAEAREASADEALLFDAHGFLVEGARTNAIVALADGRLVTPPLARGGQAGVAREALLDAGLGIAETDVSREALASAREIVAVNAVRGAIAIVALGGRAVGSGEPGGVSRAVAHAFEATVRSET